MKKTSPLDKIGPKEYKGSWEEIQNDLKNGEVKVYKIQPPQDPR